MPFGLGANWRLRAFDTPAHVEVPWRGELVGLLCGMPTTPLNLDKYEAFYPGVPGEEARLRRYIQDHYGFVLGDGIDRLHRRSYRFQLHVQRRRTRLLVRKFNAVGDAAAAAGGALRKVVHAFGRAVGKTKLLDELRKRMEQPEA